MNTTKRFAVALTLLIGLCLSTQAQVLSAKGIKLQSIEVSPGIADLEKGVMYGASFLGKTSGALPGSFFITMNYDMTSRLEAQASLPRILPSTESITSGTWSLPVYRGIFYQGAIYGHIEEGVIQETLDQSGAVVNMTLIVDGGTQAYNNVSGMGTFSGTLNRVTKDGRQAMNGTLSIDLLRPVF